jgi:hypothetical protein
MKYQFFILFLAFSWLSNAQITIIGTVYNINGPLEGAAVYLNNSMLGTTTNELGKFELPVQKGQYELIVSFLGYQKVNYNLNTDTYKKPLVFALQEEENMLDEIVVKKVIYDQAWYNNLANFKRMFIGTTEFSKNCSIKNEKDLYFSYNAKKNIFTADSKKPLIIINKSLGYKITYDMVHFEIDNNLVTRLGYSRFENLLGSKKKMKKWAKNRAKAYKGSFLHFVESVVKNNTIEDGFIINQFKRVPNPDRPTEEEITAAKETIKLQARKNIFSFGNIDFENPKNAIDSAHVVLKKKRLPKTKDYVYKTKLNPSQLISIQNGKVFLKYKDHLNIVYTKEKEEISYLKNSSFFSRQRKPTYQTSSIITRNNPIEIDNNFLLINPLDIYLEGYWAYEKMGEMLHIGYKLKDKIPN